MDGANTSTAFTPESAWKRLSEGNTRFVLGHVSHPNQDAQRRRSLVERQSPFAAIFGCSDSRLAAEIIFDLGLGDAFVVRSAGQVVDLAILGSIEYSVAFLRVPLIVVLGHDHCGAITASSTALDSGTLPSGSLRILVDRITPSILASKRAGRSEISDYMLEHIRQTLTQLVDRSAIIAAAVNAGEVAIVGLAYRLSEGKTEFVSSIGNLRLL